MLRVITKLQAMSHPTVVATINCLSEMAQRLQDENDALKKSWVGLTEDEVAQAMYRADAIVTGPMQFKFAKELEAKLKEKNT